MPVDCARADGAAQAAATAAEAQATARSRAEARRVRSGSMRLDLHGPAAMPAPDPRARRQTCNRRISITDRCALYPMLLPHRQGAFPAVEIRKHTSPGPRGG